jgi:ribosomal 30S subunit maturation factor RimM
MNEIDEFTIRLLTNAGLMNINQDELGHVAEVIRDKNNEIVMLKKMADGSKVLAIFNTDSQAEKQIEISSQEVGIDPKSTVYDVWRQKYSNSFGESMKVKLSANGVALFQLK